MNEKEIYDNFLEVLESADIKDLFFEKEKVKTHYEVEDEKTGYALKSVKGISVPNTISLVYVHGKGKKGEYWYVVIMMYDNGVMIPESSHEILCNSDKEAKQIILRECIRIANEKDIVSTD